MARGVFIVFEGIDASGKSTHARRVASDRDALFTFEPGDTPLGAQLRQWLLESPTPMSSATEALLMLSDRAHHVATVIEPALASGRDVVSDRFAASTLAYQGFGRGLDLSGLQSATDLAVGSCQPDVTILLDVPVDVAHSRRARSHDRFESAGTDFAERVRHGFLEMAAREPESWRIVDGTGSVHEVGDMIDAIVAEALAAHHG